MLVIATGAQLAFDETEGLTGPGWNEKVFTFYDLAGASALEQALAAFEGGSLVVNVVDMPIKCPVAPLEFCFLADWYSPSAASATRWRSPTPHRSTVPLPSPSRRRRSATCSPRRVSTS